MTSIPLPAMTSNETRLSRFLDDTRNGASILWQTALAMLAAAILCLGLQFIDQRMLSGVNVWVKPAKFFVSLGIHFATVSWAIALLPAAQRGAGGIKAAAIVMATSGWLENIYISIRAFRGEASHFNVATPLDAALYGLMGLGALSITVATGFVGFRLWQNRRNNLWTEAAGLGLMLGAVFGTLAGGYMSAQTGHSVGASPGDFQRLAIFGWSLAAGDLRVAHFVGLHATQFVPFAALSGGRGIVYAVAIIISILTVLTFLQAFMGIPLLRG